MLCIPMHSRRFAGAKQIVRVCCGLLIWCCCQTPCCGLHAAAAVDTHVVAHNSGIEDHCFPHTHVKQVDLSRIVRLSVILDMRSSKPIPAEPHLP